MVARSLGEHLEGFPVMRLGISSHDFDLHDQGSATSFGLWPLLLSSLNPLAVGTETFTQ